MTVYKIRCEEDHEFDVWFCNSAAYGQQKDNNLISCPYCGSSDIEKVSISRSSKKSKEKSGFTKSIVPTKKASSDFVKIFENDKHLRIKTAEQNLTGDHHKLETEQQSALRVLQTIVKRNCKNVGKNFSEEVRKMHYGEAKKCNIYGQASTEEIVDLYQEGIEVFPLPFSSKEDA